MNAIAFQPQTVIALHCSGASHRQWQDLRHKLLPDAMVMAPDLLGYGDNPPAQAGSATSLAAEAVPVIALIDAAARPVHLVGHSYGAAVAMRAALERPNRIASLTLYEPTAFGLLRNCGAAGKPGLHEITAMRDDVGRHMETGNVDEAMRIFFDYWQESGAWNLLSAEARTRLVERAAKVPQDFAALMGDPMELRQMRRLTMATLILRGEKAPPATRLLAERIARAIPKGRVLDIAGAGHMGPLTHRDIVAERMAGHVRRVAGVEPADLYVAA